MNLNIYNYNNYYNRKFLKQDTLEEYGDPIHSLPNVKSFTPNDGVNTQHIFGSAANNYDGSGDYLIVSDSITNEIISRWFIIETQFNREGQWILTLHRDVVVDYYDQIIKAPCKIDKAILPSWNPLTLNSEDITVNLIKKGETLLKDHTDVAWIVGYYNNKPQATPEGGLEPYLLELSPDDNVNVREDYDIGITESFDEWFGTGQRHSGVSNQVWEIYADYWTLGTDSNKYTFNTQLSGTKETVRTINSSIAIPKNTSVDDVIDGFAGNNAMGQLVQYTNQYLKETTTPPLMNTTETNEFLSLNNKKVRFGDGSIRYISITNGVKETFTANISKGSNLGDYMLHRLKNYSTAEVTGAYNANTFKVKYDTTHYNITATPVSGTSIKVQVSNTVRRLQDASYNMFAIPYPTKDETFTLNGIEMTQSVGLRVATALADKYASGGVLYDLQLVPFCPIQDIVKDVSAGERVFDLPASEETYSVIYNYDDTVIGYMLHAESSSFTGNIPLELSCSNTKMENLTDMYRLCSPNYNGQFEFNLAKNGSSMSYINYDCTYLPYSPYIHLNPNFSGLYGQDWDDARGLICGGDFSLPIMNDAWQAYQLQNKNYQEMFDRGIQKMEFENTIAGQRDIVQAIIGTFTGGVGAAAAGSMWGFGGIGTAISGAVGGIASGIGGFADVRMNAALRQEALDYTKDMYQFQLGNVKALPQSIAKTTAYTYNNKIFPILEYYTCTDEEKEAFANKIAYNSMTVGVIGKIEDYIGNSWSYTTTDNKKIESKGYIKGSLIRLEDINEGEFHLLNAIADEVYKGVFF